MVLYDMFNVIVFCFRIGLEFRIFLYITLSLGRRDGIIKIILVWE